MKIAKKCSCTGDTDLMFACSGVADTAEIGDRAVRRVHQSGTAKMFCLAGIAGGVELIEMNTRAAGGLIVVDGCDSDCARRTMEKAGYHNFHHLRVTDLGYEKGKTPVTEERIGAVAERILALIAAARQSRA